MTLHHRDHDVIAAALSREIYRDRIEFEKACVRLGTMPGACFDHAGTQSALVRRRDAAWLVFRGTEASRFRLLDIVANLKASPRPWAGAGWAHRGYADALERVGYPARRLAEEVSSTIPLYVTGHSLGGVLATLYAAWVSFDVEHGHRLAGLVTFGAPRGGTTRTMQPIRDRMKVRRYVMPGDPAPLWPWPYRHPGRAIRLDAPEGWPWPLARHSADGYVRALTLR